MMNKEHRRILKTEHYLLSKVKLEDLTPYLKEYKIFNKYMWKDIETTEDMLNQLPHRGPRAFWDIIEILRKAKYHREANQLEDQTLAKKSTEKDLYYVMSTKPLGFCLIINNVEFHKPHSEKNVEYQKLEYRHGSDVDATSLQDFFEMLDFRVTIKRNMAASEMFSCLEEFSQQDFSNVDSMIVIILSHGGQLNNKDFIYGSDHDIIDKSDICDIFNNKNCTQLQNKPKVFFFICCRGKSLDYGVSKCLPNESSDSCEVIMPSLSDMFVVHSTLPLQVSLRDHEKGSYFCEELITVLKEHFRTHDLETVIKLVNRNLQNRVSRMYRNIQVAHIESLGGTKKIMFCKTVP